MAGLPHYSGPVFHLGMGATEQMELKYHLALMRAEISPSVEDGYLDLIKALAMALSDAVPDLQKNGVPFIGYAAETGNRGIVGYLRDNGYSKRSDRDLRQKLTDAIKMKS